MAVVRRGPLASIVLLGGALLGILPIAGCATPYGLGVAAARAGRYAEATAFYEQALARDPDRLDALVRLGIARYKLGALDEAIDVLERARARAPRETAASFYLGLAYLRKGDLGRADEHLTAFLDLDRDRRLAAQVERTLKLMRSEPLSEEMRAFAAASLENEAELAHEANEARRALQNERMYWGYPGGAFGPVCFWRAGRLRCY